MRTPTLLDVFSMALGGAMGTLARFCVGWCSNRLLGEGFPFGTLAVNVLGCFLMGLAGYLTFKTHAAPQFVVMAITIGFLGGFTTFSAFGNETFRHFEAGRPTVALVNIAANVLIGLLAVWGGNLVARAMPGGA